MLSIACAEQSIEDRVLVTFITAILSLTLVAGYTFRRATTPWSELSR